MKPTKILIVGVGDAGVNTLLEMARICPDHPPMLAVNTEERQMPDLPRFSSLMIGARQLKGFGAGGDPRMGQRAMEAELPSLRPFLDGVDLILLALGLGGGTATGAAPLIASEARKTGTFVIALALMPFDFESRQRVERARQGLMALRDSTDGVICLPNQDLLPAGPNGAVRAEDLFKNANSMLSSCLQSLWHMLAHRGIINVSFADLCSITRAGGGLCRMVGVSVSGADKSARAIKELLTHPLLKVGAVLRDTPALLLNVTGGVDLSLSDIRAVVDGLKSAGADKSLTHVGMACDPEMRDAIRVMALAAENDPDRALAGMAKTIHDRSASGTDSSDRARSLRKKATQLSLFGQGAGNRFSGVEPTIMDSENLDKPTFMRRGLLIRKMRDVAP